MSGNRRNLHIGAVPFPEAALQQVRSFVFIIQMYSVMAVMALFITPFALFSREAAYWGIRRYSRWVRWSAKAMTGLESEVRGGVPRGDTLICAKHQSFFDILIICSVVERPRFVMKRQILMLPIVGYYAKRIGCIPVDRGKGSAAIRQMLDGVAADLPDPGPLIIYPQGTRVAPGARKRYRFGSAILYEIYGSSCVPAATNVGVFWPKAAILRRPGLAVVEFLPPITGRISKDRFMRELEDTVERHSNRLMRDGGFQPASDN